MGKVLGVVPAKGGSTRLPRKNILPLLGKPMFLWAAEALRQSGVCDRIIVSTDDRELADLAVNAGFDVPFLRPDHLAVDPAGVAQVALHLLEVLAEQGESYDELVITLPSSPLVQPQDFERAYELFSSSEMTTLLGVSEYDHTPFAALKNQEGILVPWFEEYFGRKSQEMPKAYRPNGALHILNVERFLQTRDYLAQPLHSFELGWPNNIDVDHLSDFELAEFTLKKRLKEQAA